MILVALYYRIDEFDRSAPFAGASLLLAGLFALATETLIRRDPRPGMASAAAIFATGCIASLALALTMALEKGWLTVSLALMVPGIALVVEKRPLASLRWLAATITAVVLGRIAWDPRIAGADLGTTPIFNWLLYGYGVPASSGLPAICCGGQTTRLHAWCAAALLFTVLLFFFEIRHFITGGDPYTSSNALAETALDVSVGLALVIGLERVRLRSGSVVHNAGALIIAALTLFAIVFGLEVSENPLFSGEAVGGRFINMILLGYGVPAILAAALALLTRGLRPRWYSATAAVVAAGIALGYLSLQVRTLYHGPILT